MRLKTLTGLGEGVLRRVKDEAERLCGRELLAPTEKNLASLRRVDQVCVA